MTVEDEITEASAAIRPEVLARCERNGSELIVHWEWEYRGQQLSIQRPEPYLLYTEDQDLVKGVVDWLDVQAKVKESKVDASMTINGL